MNIISKFKEVLVIKSNYFISPLFWDKYLGNFAFEYAKKWAEINEYLPLETIEKIRWPRFKELIKYARNNIPFYVEHWKKYSTILDNIKFEDDLRYLPIVTRGNLKSFLATGSNFIKNIPQWRYYTETTSGSTGEPLNFFFDNNYFIKNVVLGNRIWHWAEVDVLAPKLVCAPLSAIRYYPNSTLLDPRAVRVKKYEYVELIHSKKINLIFGSPIMTFDFLHSITEEKNNLTFKAAVLGGHAVSKGIRQYLKENFNCETFEFYASTESRMISIECKEHDGLHIQEDGIIIEIVDEENRPLPPGKIGRVLITTLDNWIMPLIRYQLGDIGVILPKACKCGRTFRKMFVEGRTNEMLLLRPNGDSISPAELRDILDKYFQYFERYQLVQSNLKKFYFNIIPTSLYRNSIGVEAVQKIRSIIGKEASVTLNIKNKIPSLPNGKFKYFVSNLWQKKFPTELLHIDDLKKRISGFT